MVLNWGLPSLWEAPSDVQAMAAAFHGLLPMPCSELHLCL